ncbi:MAG: hypothetical protein INH37_25220 [Myxococcaceae bacterium]|nr:hypothetical protein [Myxococcaceae bacterium]
MAELISELDADGRVTRQELRLFDEVLVWVAGVFRTGAGAAGARAGRPAEAVEWDAAPSPDRLARISSALSGYRGADRLIAHVRGVLGLRDGEVPGAPAPGSTPGPAALEAASRREADREAARRRSIGTMGLVGGAALTLLGVLLAWRSSCG